MSGITLRGQPRPLPRRVTPCTGVRRKSNKKRVVIIIVVVASRNEKTEERMWHETGSEGGDVAATI